MNLIQHEVCNHIYFYQSGVYSSHQVHVQVGTDDKYNENRLTNLVMEPTNKKDQPTSVDTGGYLKNQSQVYETSNV